MLCWFVICLALLGSTDGVYLHVLGSLFIFYNSQLVSIRCHVWFSDNILCPRPVLCRQKLSLLVKNLWTRIKHQIWLLLDLGISAKVVKHWPSTTMTAFMFQEMRGVRFQAWFFFQRTIPTSKKTFTETKLVFSWLLGEHVHP